MNAQSTSGPFNEILAQTRVATTLLATTLLVAILLAISSCTAAPDAATRGSTALGADQPLLPLFRALTRLQTHGGQVAVLQVGDSHSGNDSFSGHIREAMQARFGDAGRGLLPPGIPFAYYRPARIHVTQTGFQPVRSGAEPPGPGPFGLAGLRQQAQSGGATMTLAADAPDLTHVTIEALAQPGGGTIDLTTDDGRHATFPTAANGTTPRRLSIPSTSATTAITLTTRGDGPVDLLSWTANRATPGITWSNLGSIGAKVEILGRWDPAIIAAEAAQLRPALIILAFGTNEGFKDNLDLPAYPGQFRAALRILHRAAPEAALLIAGPPGGVRPARAAPGALCPDSRWSVPPNLPRIRAIQRRIAAEENAYFWDWADAMGGDCTIAAWAETDPPMAARDHVHLLKPGYNQTADTLFDTLMRGYAHYQQLGRP